MIKYNTKEVPTPSVETLFGLIDRYSGVSLFSARTEEDKEYSGFNPVIIITEKTIQIGNEFRNINDPLTELDKILSDYSYLPDDISLLGYISYDYKDRLEEKDLYVRKEQNIYPDFYFALYEHYIISSRKTDSAQLISLLFPFDHKKVKPELNKIEFDRHKNSKTAVYKGTSLNKQEYMDAVKKTVQYIKQGDIYQANITRAIYGETPLQPLETALELYHSNRIAYGVFASVPGGFIISTSPEMFFKTENGQIQASPIKGTINRCRSEKEDERNKMELLHSEKNIAELAMIVDLLRNDLSLVCVPGTVKVPQFPILMTLDNVYHLYADITGELLPQTGIGEILKKTFPGGSITGCPKIRSCQIIDELESTPRGVYTGSFGKISFKGKSVFNIMIRSLFQSGTRIIFNVGGGITLLSDPEEEYEETIHKGTNIWKAINMENINEEQYYTEE